MRIQTIKQIGIVIKGYSTISLWGGGSGEVEMNEVFLPNEKITPKNILKSVNDGQFGCQSIDKAEINIYIKFNNRYTEYDRTIFVDNPIHTQFFGKRGI